MKMHVSDYLRVANSTLQTIKTISWIKDEVSKKNGKLLSLMISGAHLYGFASEDSDIDYRGTFLADTNALLGLNYPRDVIEIQKKGDINDVVLFELKKEVGLAIAGNCNVLEHLTAKQLYTTKEYLRLKELIMDAFGKNGLYNSYKGMATFNYKKFILQGKNSVKKYLYVFRGLMAGIYALQTGMIEPNIEVLNRHFKIPEVRLLIGLKRAGTEKGETPQEIDTGVLDAKVAELFQRIDEAYAKSKMKEKPDQEDVEVINQFLISVRREQLGALG